MNYSPAGFGLRFFADFIDFLLVSLPLGLLFALLTGDGLTSFGTGWTYNLIYLLYLTLLPLVWNGYVVGKRMMKIRIMRVDDEPLTFKNMILREVVGKFLLSSVTFGISGLVSLFMVIFREDKRAIHDFIGGTYVGYEY
ncbi:RDD family protein [Neobacillus piezotolerans]|uniref:RDD family protein n=1 Tax=Neobacillus piezotolerans TaxID=2259171 RepID=A0A3D8GU13_9BACI|nr:RDD family protein [Neobacillus piezotolerans]RDU37925.1 RDD family protein [Neobacillus piezotolerans]